MMEGAKITDYDPKSKIPKI